MPSFPDSRLSVLCCGHVFRHQRPILFVSRHGGNWQFLCGGDDHGDPHKPHYIQIGMLVEYDPSLTELADLPMEWEAERAGPEKSWIRASAGATAR